MQWPHQGAKNLMKAGPFGSVDMNRSRSSTNTSPSGLTFGRGGRLIEDKADSAVEVWTVEVWIVDEWSFAISLCRIREARGSRF